MPILVSCIRSTQGRSEMAAANPYFFA